MHSNSATCDILKQSSPLSGYARTICTTKGVDCEDVKVHDDLLIVYQCVETHLGGEGKRSHVDTHTPTLHAEI